MDRADACTLSVVVYYLIDGRRWRPMLALASCPRQGRGFHAAESNAQRSRATSCSSGVWGAPQCRWFPAPRMRPAKRTQAFGLGEEAERPTTERVRGNGRAKQATTGSAQLDDFSRTA